MRFIVQYIVSGTGLGKIRQRQLESNPFILNEKLTKCLYCPTPVDPLFQQQLIFNQRYGGCVLQVCFLHYNIFNSFLSYHTSQFRSKINIFIYTVYIFRSFYCISDRYKKWICHEYWLQQNDKYLIDKIRIQTLILYF